ncbi:MAG: triphosphoribosyl-dephospho-CoA synthase [Euryarchaeota archaeon]|nr:triphosphoribosyl-dephospho-CoA synthase [Euryarchaeota archaeon]
MNPNNTVFSCHTHVGESLTPSLIARCAQLAMLLEVSASPKPGNVDREHNYPDTCFEHFLASSVAVYPVLELAAKNRERIGALLRSAVYESSAWQQGGNTHFGAFLLLIPLSMAAGELSREQSSSGKEGFRLEIGEYEELASRAHSFVRSTDCEDAVDFYRAFGHAGVRVNSVDEFDLKDPGSTADLRKQNITLYTLMDIARDYDLIANEWVSGFRLCLECAKSILGFMHARNYGAEALTGSICSGTGINEAVVYTFLKLLSMHRDTFIQTKFDAETADYVSSRAGKILSDWETSGKTANDFVFILPEIQEFDSELLEKRINPGSTADIIIAGLFIALLGGLRF